MEKLNQYQQQQQQLQQQYYNSSSANNNIDDQSSSLLQNNQNSSQLLDQKYRSDQISNTQQQQDWTSQQFHHLQQQNQMQQLQQQHKNRQDSQPHSNKLNPTGSNQSDMIEGGSVMIDSSAVECLERLMLSEPTQKMEHCTNTNWQQLEMLVAILQQTPPDQYDEIFTLHLDPKQNNKVILTETQFNLVRKIYVRSFTQGDNKFSLNDDQMINQFFMNLKAMYHRIQKNGIDSQGGLESARKGGNLSARKQNSPQQN